MSNSRSATYYAASYVRVCRTFRNGVAIAMAHHHRLSCDRATMWDGTTLNGPEGRAGLEDAIVEIFGREAYTHGGFYSPKPGDIVLDLGANVGVFAAWVAKSSKDTRILAFEPSDENFGMLTANAVAWPGIQAFRLAIGGSPGKATLKHTSRSLDHQLDATEAGDVTVVTLGAAADAAGPGSPIALLKMDIEGSEAEVFAEPQPSGLMSRFRRIVIEWHEHLRPGVLELLKERLAPTHEVVAIEAEDPRYGLLQAIARGGDLRAAV